MISVTLGTDTKTLDDALSGGWLVEQVHRRRAANFPVCVRIEIKQPPEVNLVLATPGCPPGQASFRPLMEAEKGVIEFWERLGLNDANWRVDQLVAFLRKLVRLAA